MVGYCYCIVPVWSGVAQSESCLAWKSQGQRVAFHSTSQSQSLPVALSMDSSVLAVRDVDANGGVGVTVYTYLESVGRWQQTFWIPGDGSILVLSNSTLAIGGSGHVRIGSIHTNSSSSNQLGGDIVMDSMESLALSGMVLAVG